MSMTHQIIILAAGRGKRMGGAGLPKVLRELKGKPVISYLLEEIKKLEHVPKPVVVVGYGYKQVQGVLGDACLYALQKRQLGTAHAVMSAEKQIIAANLLVLHGDVPLVKAASIKKLMGLHEQNKAKISMFTAFVPNFGGKNQVFERYGRIIRDKFGNIIQIREFADANETEKIIREINPAIYMFNTRWLWDNIHEISNRNAQGEYYLTDIVEIAIAAGEYIYNLPISFKQVIGVDTPELLQVAAKNI